MSAKLNRMNGEHLQSCHGISNLWCSAVQTSRIFVAENLTQLSFSVHLVFSALHLINPMNWNPNGMMEKFTKFSLSWPNSWTILWDLLTIICIKKLVNKHYLLFQMLIISNFLWISGAFQQNGKPAVNHFLPDKFSIYCPLQYKTKPKKPTRKENLYQNIHKWLDEKGRVYVRIYVPWCELVYQK